MTTKIKIKGHVAEYMISKYGEDGIKRVKFPVATMLHHLILDLLAVRPIDNQVDDGNLEIVLPNTREGKNLSKYNYLSQKSASLLEKKMEQLFWADLHDYIDERKHCEGILYIEAIYCWQQKYQIDSISDDALKKSYYRWREKIRRRNSKRGYKRFKK